MTYIYRALTGMILQSNDERFTRSLRRPEKGPRGFAARAWCGAAWRATAAVVAMVVLSLQTGKWPFLEANQGYLMIIYKWAILYHVEQVKFPKGDGFFTIFDAARFSIQNGAGSSWWDRGIPMVDCRREPCSICAIRVARSSRSFRKTWRRRC